MQLLLLVTVASSAASEPAKSPALLAPAPPEEVEYEWLSPEEIYEAGRATYEAVVPPEWKAQWGFPTRERWMGFVAELQRASEGPSLEALAAEEDVTRALLATVRQFEGGEELLTWLGGRLDLIEVAKAIGLRPPETASRPGGKLPLPGPGLGSTPPPRGEVKPPTPALRAVPYTDVWVGRMKQRRPPARAAELRPRLEPIFAAEGVSPALVWLAEVESSFDPEARSPAGARGLFQLMPATAQSLGLSTLLPDERTDPEKNARAAAQLLRQLHGKFDDWPLTLAAYNAGEGRVRRLLKAHAATTFAEIAPHLPAETRLYVPKVDATLEVRTGAGLTALPAPRARAVDGGAG